MQGIVFEGKHLSALQRYYGKGKIPYFKLINKGVQFCEFVGVIQVGSLVIEVLPKADNQPDNDSVKNLWHNLLIGMLRAVGTFDIRTPSSSNLAIKPHSILELYFELFIKEVEYLVHTGLIKCYRKTESNTTALKGSLVFSQHIQKNIVHQERFYTRYSTYDTEHILHIILFKAIKLIKTLTSRAELHNRIGALELGFPEMPEKPITESTFTKLIYSRKTEIYRNAIDIARLLLLNYHPDLKAGGNNVLALMFDMNQLWESFVYVSLRKGARVNNSEYQIMQKPHKLFWRPDSGNKSSLEPDIVIRKDELTFVLDTKWKNLNGGNPNIQDLRQMYVYHDYYEARKVALVYPGVENSSNSGRFLDIQTAKDTDKSCGLMFLKAESNIHEWQESIYREFCDWASG
ncbi:MAG: restriction endonuclease [Candidatus Cloacimonetes bacterium HGW-Cloacimonetes-1]|nr:MAG: restriction endonuclease [Candidatus Cloacimonetes bacterium HGW-Cloacimonetes-1]